MSPTPSIDTRLFGLTDSGRSVTLPCLRNFGDQPANGPNSSHDLPLITRVSRCGTDIGGAPSGGSAVHLGLVRGGQHRIAAAKPLAADREAAEAFDLVDARLLQQRQCATAGADEDELGVELAGPAGAPVDDLDRPAAVGLLAQVAHLVAEQGGHSVLGAEADQLPRQ